MGQRLTPTEMLDKLVAFDTTSRNSNLALIGFIADYLGGFGISSEIIHSPDGDKANLFATVGPERSGGIVLSGHTDVVPVDGQDWSSDPFAMIEKDGRLYGRGTADMKGFIACVLAMVPDFIAADLKLPLHFAFSYDEEVGCLGVGGLINFLHGQTWQPRLVIVGEPTLMKVVNAHKACAAYETRVTGLDGHSSAPEQGVNAIEYAAELIGTLTKMAAELRDRGDESGRFDPPYSTLQVGTVHGGTAANIIARECRFKWDFRALPWTDVDEVPNRLAALVEADLLPRMRQVHPGAMIETTTIARAPGLSPLENSPAESLALALTRSNDVFAVSYGTEAGTFQEAGVPAVVCGPGSIDQAHKPNEFLALSELNACTDFLRRLSDYAAS